MHSISSETRILDSLQQQQLVEDSLRQNIDTESKNVLPAIDNSIAEQPIEAYDPSDKTLVAESVSSATRAPGDEILLSIQRISDSQGSSAKNMNDTLKQMVEKDEITVQDTLKLQQMLIEYQLTQELMAKSADKVSQGAQTLFRNQ